MLKVFVNLIPFYVGKSTDRSYVKNYSKSSKYLNAEFYYPHNIFWGLKENIYAIINKICSILHIPFKIKYSQIKRILCKEYDESKFDVVYTNERVPINIGSLPAYIETTFWKPGDNVPFSEDANENFQKVSLEKLKYNLSQKSIINLKSDKEISNALSFFPEYKDRFVKVPFLLPSLNAIPQENLIEKHKSDSRLKLLFVGREAKRKNLPKLISAYKELFDEGFTNVELHIVSEYRDGKIDIPTNYNIIEHGKLSLNRTRLLFKECHVLVLLSERESYGLVYIEAMANGCIILARDFYPQNELVDFGKIGFLANPFDIIDIKNKLKIIYLMNSKERIDMAIKALNKFNVEYSYESACEKMKLALEKCSRLK